MSWGPIYTDAEAGLDRRKLTEALNEATTEHLKGYGEVTEETRAQIKAATAAARDLASSGVAGERVRIVMSGHSTEGHQIREGSAAPSVVISLQGQPEPAETEPSETAQAPETG